MTKIRLGSYQGAIVEGEVDQNVERVKTVLEETRSQRLHFLCFPEAYLTGYSEEAIHHAAISLDDARLQDLIDFTASYSPVVLVGLCERREGQIFNTQVVIHKGRLLGACHKTMLTDYDRQFFSTDLELPVFDAYGVRFGVVICHGTSFVEPALYLRWRGARLLFTPHYNAIPLDGLETSSGRVSFWGHRTMVLNNQAALATLLKMVVVRSNVILVSEEGIGAGDSNIWDMDGVCVASGEPFTEQVVTAAFERRIFQREHWIDRREIPVQLLEMIAAAARDYPALARPLPRSRQSNQEKAPGN